MDKLCPYSPRVTVAICGHLYSFYYISLEQDYYADDFFVCDKLWYKNYSWKHQSEKHIHWL